MNNDIHCMHNLCFVMIGVVLKNWYFDSSKVLALHAHILPTFSNEFVERYINMTIRFMNSNFSK